MVRLADLAAAEAGVDRALAELRAYSQNPAEWSAHERLNDSDMRELVIHAAHFERLEHLQRSVEVAAATLQATQRAFAGTTEPGL